MACHAIAINRRRACPDRRSARRDQHGQFPPGHRQDPVQRPDQRLRRHRGPDRRAAWCAGKRKYVPMRAAGRDGGRRRRKLLQDIGNIGAEPQRAAVINFTAAYCEIEATYLVPARSPIRGVGGNRPARQAARGDRAASAVACGSKTTSKRPSWCSSTAPTPR